MAMVEKAVPLPLTREDLASEIKWVNQRIDDLRTRLDDQKQLMKLLVRILIDKKIMSPELAKTFEETVPEDLVKWLLDIKKVE